MKSLPRWFTTIILLGAGSVAYAADSAPGGPAAAEPKEEHPETELHDRMEKMETAYKKLKRQAADAAMNSDSLAQVAILREVAEAATGLEPFKVTEIPAADRPKMIEGYKAKLGELRDLVGKLENAFKAGQNEEAVRLVKALHDLEKEGHKEYKSKAFK
jgi:hypothetical protein